MAMILLNTCLFSQNKPTPEQEAQMRKQAEEIMKQENAKRQQPNGVNNTTIPSNSTNTATPNKLTSEKEAEMRKQAQEIMNQENAKRNTGTGNANTAATNPIARPMVNTSSGKLTPEILWSLGRIGEFSISLILSKGVNDERRSNCFCRKDTSW